VFIKLSRGTVAGATLRGVKTPRRMRVKGVEAYCIYQTIQGHGSRRYLKRGENPT